MIERLSTEIFINRAKIIHNNKYDYSKVIYGHNNLQKVIIICPIHGEFLQIASNHLVGKGCKRCVRSRVTHDLSSHRTYYIWLKILSRCDDPKDISYKNYGARGISISEEFRNLVTFIDYVENLPNFDNDSKLQLDRINNNGNYERDNLRWADISTQRHNSRPRKDNSTPYRGVTLFKKTGRYRSYVYINNKEVSCGRYATIKEAVEARNKYIIENNLPHLIQEYKEDINKEKIIYEN